MASGNGCVLSVLKNLPNQQLGEPRVHPAEGPLINLIIFPLCSFCLNFGPFISVIAI